MERAIRVVSVERGHDPRRFALRRVRRRRRHARVRDCRAARHRHGARAAACRRPVGAGHARRRRDARLLGERADAGRSAAAPAISRHATAPLVARARFVSSARRVQRDAACASSGWSTCATSVSRTRSRCRCRRVTDREFDRRHARLYGYANPERPAEVVAVRVRAPRADEQTRAAVRAARAARRGRRPAAMRPGRFDGRAVPTCVLSLGSLSARCARRRSRRHHRRRSDDRRAAGLAVQRRWVRKRGR